MKQLSLPQLIAHRRAPKQNDCVIADDFFFRAHDFNPSEDGGWEIVLQPGDRWLRWHDGTVYFGNGDEMDPMIDGPPQDKAIRKNVDSVRKLKEVLANLLKWMTHLPQPTAP